MDRDDAPDHAIHVARDQQDATIPLIGHEDHGSSERTGRGEVPQESYPPLTDQEWVEHVSYVRDSLEKANADGLATDHLYTIDPDRQQWTPERNRIQGEIVRDLYNRASAVPCEHKALVAGGLGGAGKTTILTEQAGVDVSQDLPINPDDIKEEMARRGIVPKVAGLSPMEASDLVHEESSAIAKQLARLAQTDGKNVIWDITMSSSASTAHRIDTLKSAGYMQIHGLFVDIPLEVSIRRTESRHREGHDRYRAGEGLGGRFVPHEVIRGQADPEWGSRNRKTFEEMKGRFDNWVIYDNSVDGQSATLTQSSIHG